MYLGSRYIFRCRDVSPEKMASVVRKSASTLGWSVMAPDTMRPPVLKKPISEMRSAESASDRPRCCVI